MRAIGDRLRVALPSSSSAIEVENAFTTSFKQTAELIVPPQERRMPLLRWNSDTQTEAEFSPTKAARCSVWRWLKVDPEGDQGR